MLATFYILFSCYSRIEMRIQLLRVCARCLRKRNVKLARIFVFYVYVTQFLMSLPDLFSSDWFSFVLFLRHRCFITAKMNFSSIFENGYFFEKFLSLAMFSPSIRTRESIQTLSILHSSTTYKIWIERADYRLNRQHTNNTRIYFFVKKHLFLLVSVP